MTEETKGKSAVYVSWGTFKNALDSMAQGMPNQIDRSAFRNMSGGVQNQLFSGLKFLGLTDDSGTPTPLLHALAVTDEVARKKKLQSLLKERYAQLFALDLTKATQKQLNDTLEKWYSVTGDTRDKASRFFLQAAQYAEVPLSRWLQQTSTTASNGTPVAPRRRRSPRQKPDQSQTPPEQAAQSGTSRVVSLKGGGTLTVIASVDLFKLGPTDRAFVFGLIDKLEEYEREGNP